MDAIKSRLPGYFTGVIEGALPALWLLFAGLLASLLFSGRAFAEEKAPDFETSWETLGGLMPFSLNAKDITPTLKDSVNPSDSQKIDETKQDSENSVSTSSSVNDLKPNNKAGSGSEDARSYPPKSKSTKSLKKEVIELAADDLDKKELFRIKRKWPILALQEHLDITVKEIKGQKGVRRIALLNLNKNHTYWYLLGVTLTTENENRYKTNWYHIENAHPETSRILISDKYSNGIVIEDLKGKQSFCSLWSDGKLSIQVTADEKKPYASLCEDKIFLRFSVSGYRTTKEWVVEFLRDKVWGGENITDMVKRTIYKDKFLIDADVENEKITNSSEARSNTVKKQKKLLEGSPPKNASISDRFHNKKMTISNIGLDIEGIEDPEEEKVLIGKWYPLAWQNGVYFSALEAEAISDDILNSHSNFVQKLDSIEKRAASYFVAFDLDKHKLHFALGTEHPRLGWSQRSPQKIRDNSLGPDGFDDSGPIVTTGIIPPFQKDHIIAAFTGGFKRSHGAFKWGARAQSNNGTHYGFMENGVVFSKLQIGLVSLVIYKDGRVDIKAWKQSDNESLSTIRHVRQNGVPILVYDEESEKGIPGRLVSNWTLGNWSGSQEGKLRSLRAGVCLAEIARKKYLIYGYFSSVTPAAMARSFQAYGCQSAMHLDMNALEHTYLSIYDPDKARNNKPSHIIKGMKVLDERFKGNVPRFIGYPDNRDFFYLTGSEAQ